MKYMKQLIKKDENQHQAKASSSRHKLPQQNSLPNNIRPLKSIRTTQPAFNRGDIRPMNRTKVFNEH